MAKAWFDLSAWGIRASELGHLHLQHYHFHRMEFSTVRQIPYTIAGSSEHSGKYVAENILVDKPEEQSSRWSGAYQAGNVKQWILLKTTDTCVLS